MSIEWHCSKWLKRSRKISRHLEFKDDFPVDDGNDNDNGVDKDIVYVLHYTTRIFVVKVIPATFLIIAVQSDNFGECWKILMDKSFVKKLNRIKISSAIQSVSLQIYQTLAIA